MKTIQLRKIGIEEEHYLCFVNDVFQDAAINHSGRYVPTEVAERLLEAAKAVLEVESEPCRLDHHGLCQTHNLRTNDNGEPECQIQLLKDAIKQAEEG